MNSDRTNAMDSEKVKYERVEGDQRESGQDRLSAREANQDWKELDGKFDAHGVMDMTSKNSRLAA